MSEHAPIGVGIVGMGFMGRTHLAAWRRAEAAHRGVRVLMTCDRRRPGVDPDADLSDAEAIAAGNLDTGAGADAELAALPPATHVSELESVLQNDAVDVVSLCTPTDTHVDLAIAALEAGKHVLLEKPVAIRPDEIERLIAAASKRPYLICMPAMCMRFWPGWDWLLDADRNGPQGRLRALHLRRQGSPPDWAADFYGNPKRSGGMLHDLHVHDADIVHRLFGRPDAVTSTGAADRITTLYHYRGDTTPSGLPSPETVIAEGSWALPAAAGFRMRYSALFEDGLAEWDLDRDPCLTVADADGVRDVPASPFAGESGYDGEVRHMLAAVQARRTAGPGATQPGVEATLDDALAVCEMLIAEGKSLAGGKTVSLGG
ncbi:MAG: Gfo/Idh/MocA family protein [Phycisphaerales bacterium]